ncbi:DGQHR domain-containing protein [Caballeronia sp. LZ001]|uniref:DGQHR domain-containing protein n=1 Tax=Caballeronia sp. LZ001 TaxID=3038553 RepID=UPI00285C6D24|nr:DGQHR domain-containing protein [Caballeronia sp. LZ001]MDR5803486.1 DGQHR domain-containing protein [Caballeronia sp. LZ001]
MTDAELEQLDYTFSLIIQGRYRFLSLTIPSDVLADTCFVTTRFDDQEEGFQRRLDERRAREIADYIDNGFGTIPNALILSAQPEAQLEIKKGRRALQFLRHPKAFLVLDGQHRVWGYKLAKSQLRVPVIIYQNLSRKEETRLFIDINTKQRPVPSELLLDIKHLADLEQDTDQLKRELYDLFNSEPESVLLGLLSPAEKSKGKITRTTFSAALSIIEDIIKDRDAEELFPVFNAYLSAMYSGMERLGVDASITTPNVFKAIIALFPDVASKVKDRFSGRYSIDNFADVTDEIFERTTKSRFTTAGKGYKPLLDHLALALTKSFSF